MTLTTYAHVFLAGLAGGCLLETLHWYALRKEALFPEYAKSPRYWIATALMALAGGGLSLLYFGARADGLVAVHVGLSAPLILQKLAGAAFEPSGARSGGTSIWSFFRW
jgi:hypothetical protein